MLGDSSLIRLTRNGKLSQRTSIFLADYEDRSCGAKLLLEKHTAEAQTVNAKICKFFPIRDGGESLRGLRRARKSVSVRYLRLFGHATQLNSGSDSPKCASVGELRTQMSQVSLHCYQHF